MASPLSSRFRFWDPKLRERPGPREWEDSKIQVLVPLAEWENLTLATQGRLLPLKLEKLKGETAVIADWPQSGPGKFFLKLTGPDRHQEFTFEIEPRKISPESYSRLISDLENRLPSAIAMSIDQLQGRVGARLTAPDLALIDQELMLLRRAVFGLPGIRPGLKEILRQVGANPHRNFSTQNPWVQQRHVRRPSISGLIAAISRPQNTDANGLPLQVLDTRVKQSLDTYENKIICSLVDQINLRSRHLERTISSKKKNPRIPQIRDVLKELGLARQSIAAFRDVKPLTTVPDQITMVLLKRPEYRIAYEILLELNRNLSTQLQDSRLDSPIDKLPDLYQLWCTLEIFLGILDAAKTFDLNIQHRLTRRVGSTLFVKVIPDGKPAIELSNVDETLKIIVVPEQTFGEASDDKAYSVSYSKRPDIVVSIESRGTPASLLLFDPKYNLSGEITPKSDTTKPCGVDINKMHTYRDAIRGADGRRSVKFAAIVYPGQEYDFTDVAALSGTPGVSSPRSRARQLLEEEIATHMKLSAGANAA